MRFYSETDFASRLWLAQLELVANQPDAALGYTREIHEHPDRFPLDLTNRLDLLSVETSALFARKDAAKAVELIEREGLRNVLNRAAADWLGVKLDETTIAS